jgi:hypothetical protein
MCKLNTPHLPRILRFRSPTCREVVSPLATMTLVPDVSNAAASGGAIASAQGIECRRGLPESYVLGAARSYDSSVDTWSIRTGEKLASQLRTRRR